VLGALRRDRRLTLAELAAGLQRSEDAARRILGAMEQAGLAAPQGLTRARFYVLGPRFLAAFGVNTTAPTLLPLAEQEAAIVALARSAGYVRRSDVLGILPLTEEQATERLGRLTRSGRLVRRGTGKGTYYEPGVAANPDAQIGPPNLP